MPGKLDHAILAAENCKALRYICQRVDDFPQWATIIAFYVCVQCVEALFAHDGGFHSDQHRDRNDRLKTNRRYQKIWEHYREIWNDSLIARYMQGAEEPLFAKYMDGDAVMKKHIRHNMRQVLKSCRNLMGDPNFLKDCEQI